MKKSCMIYISFRKVLTVCSIVVLEPSEINMLQHLLVLNLGFVFQYLGT
jgi:hypothetical protein